MQTYDRVSSARPEGFSCEVVRHDGSAVVTLSGELDLATAPRLAACLERLEADRLSVAVDLSGLVFCDSSGLTVLIGFRNRAEELGTRFALCCPTRPVRRVFEMTNTDRLLEERLPAAGDDRGEPVDRRS